jgi:K+ transporter
MFIFLTLYVLASINKKGEIVSAINPKWGFWWFNDKTNKGTNKFVSSICLECIGTKGSIKGKRNRYAVHLKRLHAKDV